MSIRSLNRLFFVTTCAMVALLAFFAVLLFFGQRELTLTTNRRYASNLLADELRQSSDDLTRMARTFAVSGDPKFERMYWEILAIRNGEAPRPRHYERIYWDFVAGDPTVATEYDTPIVSLRTRMTQLGFTPAELSKLADAENLSNDLVQSERIAINARKGLFRDSSGQFTVKGTPDPEMAGRLLHDAKYHAAKAAIMGPVDDFFELLDSRTSDAVAAAARRAGFQVSAVLFLSRPAPQLACPLRRCRAPKGDEPGTARARNQTHRYGFTHVRIRCPCAGRDRRSCSCLRRARSEGGRTDARAGAGGDRTRRCPGEPSSSRLHQLQVDILSIALEQRRPVARQPGLHHELVLIDQSQLRQRQRELHASHEQPLARLPSLVEYRRGRIT